MNHIKSILIHHRFPLVLCLFLFSPVFSNAKEAAQSTCIKCHLEAGDEVARPVLLLKKSIHKEKEVACHDCHGGDPAAEDQDEAMSEDKGFRGVPSYEEIPEFCARCHSDQEKMKFYNLRTDQLKKYKTSQHGKLLYEKGDPNVATCVSCHGVHDIRSKNDPRSTVFKTNIPETCSRCHSDPQRMAPYGIPTDQYEQYKKSVHGERLLVKKDFRAPECAHCHGIHAASPPGFTEITNLCGYCHSKIAKYFKESPHYISKTKKKGIRCIHCHGNHGIQSPSTAFYTGSESGHCGECHKQDSKAMSVAMAFKEQIALAISRVDEAKEVLKNARNSGKNLDSLDELFENARTELVQSRAMAHTLSLYKVESKFSSIIIATDKIKDEAYNIQRNVEERKNSLIIVLLILGTIVASLLFKIGSVSKGR
jgi:hypothetical protein